MLHFFCCFLPPCSSIFLPYISTIGEIAANYRFPHQFTFPLLVITQSCFAAGKAYFFFAGKNTVRSTLQHIPCYATVHASCTVQYSYSTTIDEIISSIFLEIPPFFPPSPLVKRKLHLSNPPIPPSPPFC